MTDQRTVVRRKPLTGFALYAHGFDVQAKVIGALLMRELHTRFGRDNIGYLWLFGEPMLLAGAVGLLHSGGHEQPGSGIPILPMGVLGYSFFIIFRGMVNRAEGTLEANMPLLYHRSVTIFDMMFARAILEAVSCFVTFLILITFITAIDRATLPYRPLELLIGLGEISWFSWALSMIICAVTHDRRTVGRLVHPVTYLLMPLSGAFFLMNWIPEPYRTWLSWFPLPLIFEQLRYGQFVVASTDYIDTLYVVSWCVVLTWIGMVMLRNVRRHVHLR